LPEIDGPAIKHLHYNLVAAPPDFLHAPSLSFRQSEREDAMVRGRKRRTSDRRVIKHNYLAKRHAPVDISVATRVISATTPLRHSLAEVGNLKVSSSSHLSHLFWPASCLKPFLIMNFVWLPLPVPF